MVIDNEEGKDLVSSSPEAMKYILRTYAIDDFIDQAYHQVIYISMKQG